MRVLALCWRRVSGSGDTAEQNLVFCGLAGMIDPPRKEAYEAVAKCRRAGIRPMGLLENKQDIDFCQRLHYYMQCIYMSLGGNCHERTQAQRQGGSF